MSPRPGLVRVRRAVCGGGTGRRVPGKFNVTGTGAPATQDGAGGQPGPLCAGQRPSVRPSVRVLRSCCWSNFTVNSLQAAPGKAGPKCYPDEAFPSFSLTRGKEKCVALGTAPCLQGDGDRVRTAKAPRVQEERPAQTGGLGAGEAGYDREHENQEACPSPRSRGWSEDRDSSSHVCFQEKPL